jgi:hypothetical protein
MWRSPSSLAVAVRTRRRGEAGLIAAALLFATPATAQVDRWAAEGWRTDFTRTAVDLAEIRNVIPRDGIPAR